MDDTQTTDDMLSENFGLRILSFNNYDKYIRYSSILILRHSQ